MCAVLFSGCVRCYLLGRERGHPVEHHAETPILRLARAAEHHVCQTLIINNYFIIYINYFIMSARHAAGTHRRDES